MTDNFRDRAIQLLNEHIKNRNLVKHNLAAGALLKALAFHFGKNSEAPTPMHRCGGEVENWELAGLLHDLDWEKTEEDPALHTSLTAKILQENNFPPEVIEAIKRHNQAAGNPPPETLLEKVLYYTEEITGLIVASTLILPSKKIADLTVESVLRRLKEKSFARGIDRELLKEMPNQISISVEELISVALKTMQGMSEELGL